MSETKCGNLRAVVQFASNLTAKICSILAAEILPNLFVQQPSFAYH